MTSSVSGSYSVHLSALPGTGTVAGVRIDCLVEAQKYARAQGQDRYWRIVFFNEHATHRINATAQRKQVFFMSKADYLACLGSLADLGYRVDGSILYTDTVSDSPMAR